MNKTFLIFKHEFANTLKRTGFIIMTLIVPLVGLLAIGVYHIVSGISRPAPVETEKIGYVDEVGSFNQDTNQGKYKLVPFATTEEANGALVAGDIKEYIVIPPDYITTGVVDRYTMQAEMFPSETLLAILNRFFVSNLLAGEVSTDTANRVLAPLYLVTTNLTETGEISENQGGFGNFVFPGIFSLLLVLSIIFSSTYLLQGLGEEKDNRLIEILLSSVSPRQLLTGKVFGIGIAGLVQVIVWIASAPLLLSVASSTIGGFFSTVQLPAYYLFLAILYFILGYLLFAVISASLGAVTSGTREGQQLIGIFTLPAVAPLWFISLLLLYPNSPVWIALTIFPLTAPVAVMLRMGVTEIPIWQILVSIVVICLCIVGILALTIKIFRTYLLMYGKRPGFGQILRTLRQS